MMKIGYLLSNGESELSDLSSVSWGKQTVGTLTFHLGSSGIPFDVNEIRLSEYTRIASASAKR